MTNSTNRLTVFEHVTLDGVMQAPGRPDEDTRGGFEHGGWAHARSDEVLDRLAGEGLARDTVLLFGRRTYEDFASFWPKQADNPFTPVLNARAKHVVSTTLKEPLPWENSTLIAGDVAESVAALKRDAGKPIAVLGSGKLVHALMRHDLVDDYVLLIHPLVLGAGQRLFPVDGPHAKLRLVDSVSTPIGVVIATYQRQEDDR